VIAGAYQSSMLLQVLPEIGLVVLGGLILLFDLLWHKRQDRNLGLLTLVGLLGVTLLALVFARPPAQPQLIFGGMLRSDGSGYVFRLVFLLGAMVTVLFSMDNQFLSQRGEYYLLLVAATLGMSLMAQSADLIMLYLAIETTSIPLYVMAGSLVRDPKSVESGIKYLLFGAMTSAVMLYGFSLLYGFTGTTQIYQLAEKLQAGQLSVFAMLAVFMLIMAGFGFKISAAPFHFWAPDVYEGAPTPVAGFLSTASKAAGFAVLIRFLFAVFPKMDSSWLLVAIIATASMVVGNVLALKQRNFKRLLAYSSIAQAGYVLIGVAASSQLGNSGAIFYLMSYMVTNLAAFGIAVIVGRAMGSDEISSYAGLSRRSPGLALALLAALLSLGGVPPFSGFVGKLFVFAAAVQNPNLIWLAIVGIINSIVALYYYLNVLKVVYLSPVENEECKVVITRSWRLALVVCVVGMIVLGTVFAPWYGWATQAALAF
jgi:NADH-quinone oxidoreductase subunit N